MPSEKIPSRRFYVTDPDDANTELIAFLEQLRAVGERPWCEVWYPAPAGATDAEAEEWERAQEDAFDAVELVDGELVTLPPYTELEAGS